MKLQLAWDHSIKTKWNRIRKIKLDISFSFRPLLLSSFFCFCMRSVVKNYKTIAFLVRLKFAFSTWESSLKAVASTISSKGSFSLLGTNLGPRFRSSR